MHSVHGFELQGSGRLYCIDKPDLAPGAAQKQLSDLHGVGETAWFLEQKLGKPPETNLGDIINQQRCI